jgi:hypothetical protein
MEMMIALILLIVVVSLKTARAGANRADLLLVTVFLAAVYFVTKIG